MRAMATVIQKQDPKSRRSEVIATELGHLWSALLQRGVGDTHRTVGFCAIGAVGTMFDEPRVLFLSFLLMFALLASPHSHVTVSASPRRNRRLGPPRQAPLRGGIQGAD